MLGKTITIATAVAALTLSTGLQADPWKKSHGPGKDRPHQSQARKGGGPPPWAPAHGYRAKRGASVYYEAPDVYERHTREFGIHSGTCNRQELGTVLGGVVGGVVGSRVGDREDRTVTTIAGVVIGALIGREIGRRMDEADQACVGQVLERAADHQTVHWRNPDTGVEFQVTPQRTFQQDDRYCRTYMTVAVLDDGRRGREETACRTGEGAWKAR